MKWRSDLSAPSSRQLQEKKKWVEPVAALLMASRECRKPRFMSRCLCSCLPRNPAGNEKLVSFYVERFPPELRKAMSRSPSIRTGLTSEEIKQDFLESLRCGLGRAERFAARYDHYYLPATRDYCDRVWNIKPGH